ncbi:cytochrome P450 CYP82H23-like [Vitis riparia]|uniref:cytochrome P450 CYP82H23-like n=1 Tax=Vitis riparia TaxID=96939 RepID=UPI00155AEA66|nr:cytochrome P450 CYP82H23-like [Vitis riparia]
MADKYGPIFCFHIGLRKTSVVSSWEVAKECFTTMDKAFATQPRSLAGKLMGYDHSMFGFSPCRAYCHDVRNLASIVLDCEVELFSSHQLELLNHVRDSEVQLFIKELYGQWIQNGDRPLLVEMKEKCWHLAANVVVSAVAGKRYFGAVTNDYEPRQCRKALGDFLYLLGIFMVSDAIPFLGWLDTVRGYTAKMKRTAREVDQVLGSWVEEHGWKRVFGSMNKAHQDFQCI